MQYTQIRVEYSMIDSGACRRGGVGGFDTPQDQILVGKNAEKSSSVGIFRSELPFFVYISHYFRQNFRSSWQPVGKTRFTPPRRHGLGTPLVVEVDHLIELLMI